MFPKFNIGKKGEEYTSFLFTRLGFHCHLNNVYELRYDYDLMVNLDSLKFTAEVKYDVMSRKTKNLAIEYNNSKSNTVSGISATKADIWVHLLPAQYSDNIEAYAIKVDKLIDFTESNVPHKYIYSGGDDNADLLIYKLDKILPHFQRFDNVENPNAMKSLFEGLLC